MPSTVEIPKLHKRDRIAVRGEDRWGIVIDIRPMPHLNTHQVYMHAENNTDLIASHPLSSLRHDLLEVWRRGKPFWSRFDDADQKRLEERLKAWKFQPFESSILQRTFARNTNMGVSLKVCCNVATGTAILSAGSSTIGILHRSLDEALEEADKVAAAQRGWTNADHS